MELYENIVLAHITKARWIFVHPQYSIKGDTGEWSCPDIVALDFKRHLVLVVEVSTAANPKSLRARVADRENQWINKLRSQLIADTVIDDEWHFCVELYVRECAEARIRGAFDGVGTPVQIHVLEKLESLWAS